MLPDETHAVTRRDCPMELTWEPVSDNTGQIFLGQCTSGQSKQAQAISGGRQSQAKGKARLMQSQFPCKPNYILHPNRLLCPEKSKGEICPALLATTVCSWWPQGTLRLFISASLPLFLVSKWSPVFMRAILSCGFINIVWLCLVNTLFPNLLHWHAFRLQQG